VIFFIGAGLTVAAGALTIVSGIDTMNSPGSAAVQKDCVGQGESCQEYQDGRSKQLRTNILLGAAIGLGALTIVDGLFFTQWSHPPKAAGRGSAFSPAAKPSIEPYFGGYSRGGTLGLHGVF
ncbi:MAG: hypothetical protein ABI183_19215, partial [Polyangiaceae bacterium]